MPSPAVESPVGLLPDVADLDVRGLAISDAQLDALFAVDPDSWLEECRRTEEFLDEFDGRSPAVFTAVLDERRAALHAAAARSHAAGRLMATSPSTTPSAQPSAADRARLQRAWTDKLAAAEEMVPLIGRLYRRDDVVTSVYGRPLVGESPIGIVKAHRSTRRVDETELPVTESLAILTELDAMTCPRRPSTSPTSPPATAPIRSAPRSASSSTDELFLARGAAPHDGPDGPRPAPRDVVLYGFGRIGRMLARILLERAGEHAPLALRAVVVRRRGPDDLVKRASLLRRDSIHGPFAGTVTVDPGHDTITANGTLIQFISADAPSAVDYRAHGIEDAIVVDTHRPLAGRGGPRAAPARPRSRRVLLTAPGTGGVPNVVHGINHEQVDDAPVVSAASCTTNAIVPVLKAVSDAYGVVHGHVETVHSATNDKNLVDNYHPADRRGAGGGAEHGHHRHRCGTRRPRGPARAAGSVYRQRRPRPDAERVARGPAPDPRPARHARRPERAAPRRVAHLVAPPPDRLRRVP